MIEKLIDTFTRSMSIEHTFDEKEMTLTTRTKFGTRTIHQHVFDLNPMFNAFRRKMKGSIR